MTTTRSIRNVNTRGGLRNSKAKRKVVLLAAAAAIFVGVLLSPTASAIYIEQHDDENNNNNNNNGNHPRHLASSSKTYLITFADNSISPAKRCTALANSNGGSVVHVYDTVLNGCALTVPVTQSMQAQATFTALSSNPAVAAVEFDQPVYALQPPPTYSHLLEESDNLFADDDDFLSSSSSLSVSSTASATASDSFSWGLDRINQCSLPLDNLMTKQDATGVTVFIIDSGIRNDHVELKNSMSSEDCHYSVINKESAFSDGSGHGTHVAGTTCGANYGVSSNCKLCAVKVLDKDGRGTDAGVIAGINHVASKCSSTSGRKCVANMSLGGGKSTALNQAVANAVNAGVVIVVSAGNENTDACGTSPASEPSAITVGSTTKTDDRSSFSNVGPCVDVYAPGTDIMSSWSSSTTAIVKLSGTSMASPHVAGIAAAIRSANPSWTPEQVRNAIVDNSISLSSGWKLATIDDIAGCGTPPPPTPCPNGGVNVEVKLKTDTDVDETAWSLTNKCGSGTPVIYSPRYTSPNTMHSNKYCTSGGAYDFRITDSYGDGICCARGSGSYEVIMGGVSVAKGGSFGYSETKTFGTCPTQSLSPKPSSRPPTRKPRRNPRRNPR